MHHHHQNTQQSQSQFIHLSTKDLTCLTTLDVTYLEDALEKVGNQSHKGEKVVIFNVNSKVYTYCSVPSDGVYVIMSSWGVINRKPIEPGFHYMVTEKFLNFIVALETYRMGCYKTLFTNRYPS